MNPSESVLDFQTLGRQSSADTMRDALWDKMPTEQFQGFMRLFNKFTVQRQTGDAWDRVQAPTSVPSKDYGALEPCPPDEGLTHELLDKAVILKLNGGLGSTMGCVGPKSSIPVRDGLSFLDLTVRQVEYLNSRHGVDVPLVLMNSFKTHASTGQMLRRYRQHNITIHSFNQSCYPRVHADTLLPLPQKRFDEDSREDWSPPGHGDVYEALFQSGLLQSLIEQGKEYVFISNIDNLGSTLDLNIAYEMVNEDSEFVMEVTRPTRGDRQGGLLVEQDGRVKLVELSQVPEEHRQRFKSFNLFNTNNLWVSLAAIQRLAAQEQMDFEVNVMERTLANQVKVLQLETAAGAAISHFRNYRTVSVPRSRFLPVKSTSDLFLLQSNLYLLTHGCPQLNPARDPEAGTPVVKLSREEFGLVRDYDRRVAHGVPDLLDLDSLTVSGQCSFGRGVVLKGTVIIVANRGSAIMIPDGAVLENKVVTGDLQIVDH